MKLNTVKENKTESAPQDIASVNTQTEAEDLSELSFDEKIIYWKNKYKKLYKTIIDDETYYWRRLTRKEYVDIISIKESENNAENLSLRQYNICLKTILHPSNLEETLNDCAGLSQTLSDEIMFKSGFGDSYAKTEEV